MKFLPLYFIVILFPYVKFSSAADFEKRRDISNNPQADMLTIIFETHSTTLDNQNELASGWYDIGLSEMGELQARELCERRKNDVFDAIFCSDLQRSYRTAEIAFGNKFPIIKDARLRECNYGKLNRAPKDEVDAMRKACMYKPFPNGESYEDASKRMREFLQDLLKNYPGKSVLIIGHRATQYGLDQWANGINLKDAVLRPWRWQPGWLYKLDYLKLRR